MPSSILLNPIALCLSAVNINPMSHTVHCVTSMGAPSWRSWGLDEEECESLDESLNCGEGNPYGGYGHGEGGLLELLKQEDTESQDAYLNLYNRLDVAVREMKQYVKQIDV